MSLSLPLLSGWMAMPAGGDPFSPPYQSATIIGDEIIVDVGGGPRGCAANSSGCSLSEADEVALQLQSFEPQIKHAQS